jgi:hypothetical protein
MAEDKDLTIDKRTFDISFYEMKVDYDLTQVLDYLKLKHMHKENMLTSFFEHKNILQKEELKEFKNHVDTHINIFVRNVLNKNNFTCESSWFQIYEVDSFHPIHIHGVCENEWSLIYYMNATEKSSDTYIYLPGYPYNPGQRKKIKSEINKFVFFPSYLPHEVQPNKDNERVILSANIIVK